MTSRTSLLTLSAALILAAATPAAAYIGPGLGAGAIATVLGLIATVFVLIVAVVYYPVKRLLKKRKATAKDAPSDPGADPS